jgi:hypothetical protein
MVDKNIHASFSAIRENLSTKLQNFFHPVPNPHHTQFCQLKPYFQKKVTNENNFSATINHKVVTYTHFIALPIHAFFSSQTSPS